jgi:ketosteroid isomerase-like protein
MDPSEQRLVRLEKIEAARAALGRYARACDAKDVSRLAADVFTADIVLHVPGSDYRGTEEVSAFYRAAFDAAPGTRRHFLMNHITEVNTAGAVEIDSYFFFVSAEDQSVIGWGSYRDVIIVEGGRALVQEKTIVLDMHTTIDAGWATAAVAGA